MRTSAVARLAVMGLVTLVLMVPLAMIEGVVSERTSRRDGAVEEIGTTWGGVQTLGGPVLTVPYRYSIADQEGKPPRRMRGSAHFLPDVLAIRGSLEPEIRHRSLFSVIVYKSHLEISGRFARPDFSRLRPPPDEVLWEDATLNLGISDPRGITRRVTLNVDGRQEAFVPGVDDVGLFKTGVRAAARTLSAATNDVPFNLEIDLNGSRELRVLPAGNETTVSLASAWPHPSFVGAPLPESHQTVGVGFMAVWRAPYFGRGYPPGWSTVDMNRELLTAQAAASAFGVSLIQPVDIYQQAERAVKYAILFIVMTFVISFLWEIARGALLHPIQYLFVGFAMCVFYLLLLSLSEHVGFDSAYISAAAPTITLLAWYWSRILGGAQPGWLMGAALTGVYGFLYLLLRLEDYALLAGSIGLFAMLAAVMYLTRRVNWYDLRLGVLPPE